jgi:hypothetical protein
MLALTPISVWISAPEWVSAALLLTSLGLLFFVGQTSIFLMRLVAADRRAQRRPLREGARPTVGQLSRESEPASERESEPASERESEPEPDGASDEDEAPPTQR